MFCLTTKKVSSFILGTVQQIKKQNASLNDIKIMGGTINRKIKEKSLIELVNMLSDGDSFTEEARDAIQKEILERGNKTGKNFSDKAQLESALKQEKQRMLGPTEEEIKYPSIIRRGFAHLLDGLFFLIIAVVEFKILDTAYNYPILNSLFNLVVFYLYEVYCFSKYGQTLGKFFMDIKVVNAGDEKSLLTLKESVMRNIVSFGIQITSFLAVFTFVPDLGILHLPWLVWIIVTIIGSKNGRGIHDKMGNSVVFRVSFLLTRDKRAGVLKNRIHNS